MSDLLRALEAVAEEFPDASEVFDVDVGDEIYDSVDEEGQGAALPAGRPIQIAVVGRRFNGSESPVMAFQSTQCPPLFANAWSAGPSACHDMWPPG